MTYFDPDYDTVQFALDVGPDPVVFGNLTVTVEGLYVVIRFLFQKYRCNNTIWYGQGQT